MSRNVVYGRWLARNMPEQIPAILLGMPTIDLRRQGEGFSSLSWPFVHAIDLRRQGEVLGEVLSVEEHRGTSLVGAAPIGACAVASPVHCRATAPPHYLTSAAGSTYVMERIFLVSQS